MNNEPNTGRLYAQAMLATLRIIEHVPADRWHAPTRRWFKVDADDGHTYVLRHDAESDEWEIAAFTAGRRPVTP